MASVNKAIIIGNLGGDPESRQHDGRTVVNFTVATTDKWTDKTGEKRETTEWHRVFAWDKLAENCMTYLTKGQSVYVEGTLQTSKWTDKDGVEKSKTEIKAFVVQFLTKRTDR